MGLAKKEIQRHGPSLQLGIIFLYEVCAIPVVLRLINSMPWGWWFRLEIHSYARAIDYKSEKGNQNPGCKTRTPHVIVDDDVFHNIRYKAVNNAALLAVDSFTQIYIVSYGVEWISAYHLFFISKNVYITDFYQLQPRQKGSEIYQMVRDDSVYQR